MKKGAIGINERQKQFADAYIRSLNATQAYMEVYGTEDEKAAGNGACRLKKNPEVKRYIDKELERIRRKRRLETERIIELLAAIAFTSPADFACITQDNGKQRIVWQDVEKLPEDVKSAISSIKNTPSGISIETLDRMKAIDLLMKYLGIDKRENGGVYFEGENELED